MMEFLMEFLTAALRFLLLTSTVLLVSKALFAWAPSCARNVAGALRRGNIRVRFGSLTPEEKATLAFAVYRCDAHGKRVFVAIRRRSVIQSLVNKGAIQFRENVRGDVGIYQVDDDWWKAVLQMLHTIRD